MILRFTRTRDGLQFSRSAPRAKIRSRGARIGLAVALSLFVVPTFYGLAFGRLVINGSESLEANAFAMVTWPKVVFPGSVVAFEMPEALRVSLGVEQGSAVYVKRVLGRPGDAVVSKNGATCLRDVCLAGFERSDGATLPMWTGAVVPEGTLFVAGDSADSLDSRYALIGPRPKTDILAVGVPVALPHWRALQAMLDEGG